ncbi:EboA domain-containing protein [Actinoplanes sp. G11-F43]|uniref:EboA domain-containing protein n=1 Tax=Actinoplanes sp. G11-F43 TaxID=3424130 RepID=UPI003D3252B4
MEFSNAWLDAGLAKVAADPSSVTRLFAAAGRHCGRAEHEPGWTTDQAARARLLLALPAAELPGHLDDLYRHGDAGEKLAVLKALPLLPIGDQAVPLLHDAIRTNDTRLVAAALGPYARHLDQPAWRQAVLKCVFMGIPLAVVDRLPERADTELAAMTAGLREERAAAGRAFPEDALTLLEV